MDPRTIIKHKIESETKEIKNTEEKEQLNDAFENYITGFKAIINNSNIDNSIKNINKIKTETIGILENMESKYNNLSNILLSNNLINYTNSKYGNIDTALKSNNSGDISLPIINSKIRINNEELFKKSIKNYRKKIINQKLFLINKIKNSN